MTATANSSTSIVVMWNEVPFIDQNGIITMYEVIYIPLENFGGAIGKNKTTVTELSVLLVDLHEFVNYTISVRAYTSMGVGPYSGNLTILLFQAGKLYEKST